MKREFSRQILQIPSVGAEFFHADRKADGQTNRHDEANTRFSQFCKRAKKETWTSLALSVLRPGKTV
jgi:hypothetical protein